jgi:hypothetical protein
LCQEKILEEFVIYLFIMFGFLWSSYDAFPFVLDGTAAPCCLAVPASTERGVGSHDI